MEARVRRAHPSDKEPLMRFIRHVWGGHDYIPRVWEGWLKDPSGEVFVVEADGVPVGMNRVRFLADESAWFEGVRVHPQYRGRGLASMLGENSMKVAAKRGVETFRLTSGSRNHAAHRQISRIAFKEIARFTIYAPPQRRHHRGTGAVRVKEGGERKALGIIHATKEFRLGAGVYWDDFTTPSLTAKTFHELVRRGEVWMKGDSVAIAKLGGEGSRVWEQISFIGGPPDDALILLRSVLGRVKGASERWVFLPQGSPIIHAVRQRGYKRDFSLILFERKAAKG